MKKQSISPEAIFLPAPVTLQDLRRHFKEVYGFNLTQTEIMLESSSKSLALAFENASEALKKENFIEKIGPVFHGLKGLLLNMGESEWAAIAQDVEQKLRKEVPCDLERIVIDMQVGLADILFYSRAKGKESP